MNIARNIARQEYLKNIARQEYLKNLARNIARQEGRERG